MLLRTCLALVLLSAPVTALHAVAPCCQADESCCAGESPECPILPSGECGMSAASQPAAAVPQTVAQAPPVGATACELVTVSPRNAAAPPSPALAPQASRFPHLPSLRN
jgi:hypothetical protein